MVISRGRHLLLVMMALGLVAMTACGDAGNEPETGTDEFGIAGGEVDEFGKPNLDNSGWVEPGGKADAIQGSLGLSASINGDSLSVWTVKNAWEDTDTAAAREAGMAWGEDSGLTWEQKYQRWIDSMEKIDAESFGKTFMLTTPYGRELPAPALECAEVAMFLRITFASWYNLPWFMEARDSSGNRLYFGHFGMRTANGRYGSTPRFRDTYQDFTDMAEAIRKGEAEWPVDTKLAGRKIPGSFDDAQPMIGEDAHAGAYFDQIFLNKRVGYFLLIHLAYFGSINLADPSNTFNLAPEGLAPGDVLLERWQKTGIGHTLVVLQRTDLGTKEIDGVETPQFEAELGSGSMPRRQPRWDSPAASKRYFTDETTGGVGYETLGGGIKRWRITQNVQGRWTNVVPKGSQDHFISSRATDALSKRPERFEVLLAELSPDEKVAAMAEIVEAKRQHLRNFPASCSARIGREDAFGELYRVGKENFDWDRDEVDRRFRKLEDYVFAELVYEKSKTCCWNSSTAEMAQIVLDMAAIDVADPETGECREIQVFMNRDDAGDGYQIFRDFAEATDRGDKWVAWRADESCPQADVPEDTQAEHAWAPLCDVADAVLATDTDPDQE